jgi:hypothetical protein
MDIQEKKSGIKTQFLTHWPPLGGLNDLKNDFTIFFFIFNLKKGWKH